MNYSVLDSKLKTLIKVCKETGNYKKLGVVSFILTSNILDEIGLKLGIRPRKRNKSSEEHIFRYMELINSVFKDSLKISIFDPEDIYTIQTIELHFLKQEGELPYEYVKKMYEMYFNIRKLDIPNLHETFRDELESLHSETSMYALMSPTAGKGKKQPNKVKSLIIQKIREQERALQNEAGENYNKGHFESAIYLKKVRNSIENPKQHKIELRGQLKDNISYQRSLNDMYGFLLIGLSIVMCLLGVIVTAQTVFHPSLTGPMGVLLLSFFGSACLFLFLYWNFFRKEVK